MDFPVYRKYVTNDSFFIIHSPQTWTEYKRMGRKYLKFDFTAVQFPEKLFVSDLLQLVEGIAVSSAEEIDRLT